MPQEPSIILTSADLDRLDRLLDSVSPLHTPGLDALRRELDRAEVVESHEIPPNVITMNSTARFVDETSGKEFELTLVYPDDTLMTHGTVSVLAPVGSALLGLSVGQSIEWPLPGGRKMTLRVLEVTYQPEATRKQPS
ncbi:MAG TPA: nucleoside diphosphate kinase regulator [Candidatus Competibacteraceae bacterium]|nr:nucleoside diphosphate kinase regulator [Candidatus Competibacteraceae bacterium]HRZ07954.1 nucleoside diphosphate kinase regulator [Candidatus Competibacteraceae bacterium]HSA46766.1 nucleoside diphosphate kinase regulator [Candidatus Competibacteraceae bacterium]